jgi:hypothetical protein
MTDQFVLREFFDDDSLSCIGVRTYTSNNGGISEVEWELNQSGQRTVYFDVMGFANNEHLLEDVTTFVEQMEKIKHACNVAIDNANAMYDVAAQEKAKAALDNEAK